MKINNKDFTLEDIKAVMEEVKNNPSILEEKKSRFFIPKEGEHWETITEDVFSQNPFGDPNYTRDNLSELGFTYRTIEDRELAVARQQALVRLWNNADSDYYFRPDWSDEYQEKYYIYFDHEEACFVRGVSMTTQYIFDLPHFKSNVDGKSFISENLSDLYLYCLGVKK